ncbi:glutamine amidotransferase [Corynebacterium sp. 13CS0277]|uniref:glutamine amidotransferase n=1 Tax=Corynebacterium sp. 13CS0277 TaxID=2071994 RepID=UPI001304FBEA|nr:glutamine amidotransferase [Corynebacterium sp. 13CS0277]
MPAIRPFLLLSTRPEDPAAAGEYESFRTVLGLAPDELHHVRLERGPLGEISLDDYSGIIIGGGPFNNTEEHKSEVQLRVERELAGLVERILHRDYPLFAACYGIGVVGQAIGATLSRNYPEDASAITVDLTDAAASVPILAGTPRHFDTLVGHKENIETLPECYTRADGTTLPVRLLATGAACPVHMFSVGDNIFVTQFHPELDHDSFALRVRIYRNEGYFPPEDADAIIAQAARHQVADSQHMLRAFGQRYRVPQH